ncbi:16S rRNA (uracil(1498)-N(3))-methyltransferase [Erythrobacter sp. SCSIO 43205]|uniref:16S rRNA (uracil(1498)-N(3))-methyltransferase n=1 Tax=Erythrobacter sp. SCSIO 43205 TaxID=2779361 RepID=UPI001CA9B369|nr:16S rRNA (uracil(1498)-N(3))-methyltransferase [Erythrobacter sp. SCSIO 43205]UAB79530.1 16S rRNA (uracil(1498)-N(3))-methyltransferase [Erythrobacter sp. SCSIO 43205]
MSVEPSPRTPAWPPKSAPRLFVEHRLEEGFTITLDGPQAHYLGKVMRVKTGDTIIVCDDQTGEWASSVVDAAKRSVTLRIAERLRPRESVPDLWLCPALLKKDRFDIVLEKATELGVARIQPIITRRCVADKLNQARARTITTEAAEQCARTALPEMGEPLKLEAMLKQWPDDRTLLFADEQGGESAAKVFRDNNKAALIIGPEGGFDDAERAAIRAHPLAQPISLGPRILRAETAAIAALSIWMSVAGDWAGYKNSGTE